MKTFLKFFPKHKGCLRLSHNPYKNLGVTAEYNILKDDFYRWENKKAKQKAIKTQEYWTLKWHPDTPDKFYAVAAPTLHELFTYAKKIEAKK